MPIVADNTVFPNNVVYLTGVMFSLLDPDLFVASRPLRSSDPTQSIGVFPSLWNPVEDSYEMKGAQTGASEPTLQTYLVTVQAFIKDMDEQRGLATHATLSKILRTTLYRDEALRVGLTGLSSTMNGSIERLQRWGVRTQRFNSNELSGNWLFLSTLELWIETETI